MTHVEDTAVIQLFRAFDLTTQVRIMVSRGPINAVSRYTV